MTEYDEKGRPWCDGGGTRWDPKSQCGNRAKWKSTSSDAVYCGRHIRYAGPVEKIADVDH